MTAAYADDPTTAQEQNSEKRAVMASKTLLGKKEEGNEDETGNPSAEIAKRATGGQDKDEIAVNREEQTSQRTLITIDNQGSIGRSDKDLVVCEKFSENFDRSGNSWTNVTTIDDNSDVDRLEIKADEVINRDSDTSKSSVPLKIDAVLVAGDSRNATVAPESDSSLNIVKQCDVDDESKMQLQELRYSIESVSNQTKDLSSVFEIVKGELDEGSAVFDQLDDSYDPESKLNFHEAVRAGDAKCVAALLTSGSVQNLDEPDWNVSGDPPLLVAATNHCLPVLSLLLTHGCDPAVRSPRGETALHRVILNGGPGNVFEFVEELLKYGCPPGVKEAGGGLTALHVLTRQLAHAQGSKNLHHNFEAALKTLNLLAYAGPVNAKDHQGRSALHILTSSTIFDNSHRTEIESLIETLLTAGADPALKNDRGETPLHECLECGALNTAFLLTPRTPIGITSRYGETPLHIASRKNYADMVAKLLEHGEDPSVQDAGGNTPLHLASARGFHQTVSLLVTSPLAQLEKHNTEGLTALQVAAESGFVNAVRLLLKAGADPSQTVHYCTTTLHRHPDISVLINHELTRRRQLAA